MTLQMQKITVKGSLLRLLIPGVGDLTFKAPSTWTDAERAEHTAREADYWNPDQASEAWCAWWIERNGDMPVMISSPEGKVACESLFAFRAGWNGATK